MLKWPRRLYTTWKCWNGAHIKCARLKLIEWKWRELKSFNLQILSWQKLDPTKIQAQIMFPSRNKNPTVQKTPHDCSNDWDEFSGSSVQCCYNLPNRLIFKIVAGVPFLNVLATVHIRMFLIWHFFLSQQLQKKLRKPFLLKSCLGRGGGGKHPDAV